MRRILLILFSILAGGGFPRAQGAVVAPLNLGRHQDIGARPMAMGGTFTGIDNDFSALFYNPAGLTQIRKHEAQFTVEWADLQDRGEAGNFPARETDQDLLSVQSFGVVLPVPISVGGLSFVLGSYRPRTPFSGSGSAISTARSRSTYRMSWPPVTSDPLAAFPSSPPCFSRSCSA